MSRLSLESLNNLPKSRCFLRGSAIMQNLLTSNRVYRPLGHGCLSFFQIPAILYLGWSSLWCLFNYNVHFKYYFCCHIFPSRA